VVDRIQLDVRHLEQPSHARRQTALAGTAAANDCEPLHADHHRPSRAFPSRGGSSAEVM
jgi:hypothetical protein